MNEFRVYCPDDKTEREVSEWLLENLAPRFEIEALNVVGEAATSYLDHFSLRVVIPDDADAVTFKLRFADELERKASTSETWSAVGALVSSGRWLLQPRMDSLYANLFAPLELTSSKTCTRMDYRSFGYDLRIQCGGLGGIQGGCA